MSKGMLSMFMRETDPGKVPKMIADIIPDGVEFLGVKVHFGRSQKDGSHLDPGIFKLAKEKVKRMDFIDTNTLYGGERSNKKNHRALAAKHGFESAVILDEHELVQAGEHASVPKAVMDYDMVLNAAHFTGHNVTAFGGCMKNIGMGLVCTATKLWVHDAGRMRYNSNNCVECGWCADNCRYLSPTRLERECTSCGKCLKQCRAVYYSFGKHKQVAKRLTVVANEVNQSVDLLHFSLIDNPTELCDCMGDNTDKVIKRCYLALAGDDLAFIDRTAVDYVLKGRRDYKLAIAQPRYLKTLEQDGSRRGRAGRA